jgi:hypothetical protein
MNTVGAGQECTIWIRVRDNRGGIFVPLVIKIDEPVIILTSAGLGLTVVAVPLVITSRRRTMRSHWGSSLVFAVHAIILICLFPEGN